jgi:membrane protein DedA with SNARE-associated domain
VLTPLTAALASSPPPNLPGFLNVVAPYLEHYSYWAVLLLVMIEDFGVPVPGETILIAAAIFAGAGRLNVLVVGLVGFIAAVAGDNIGFAIGHFGGRALALRWGKYVFLTEERLAKAEVFFNRHGGKIIVVARFIEGLRQANGIIAGISGMYWLRFVVFNALGAALWVGTWVSLGYLAGNHINTIYHYITSYSYYALFAAAAVVAAALIIRHVLRRRRADRRGARHAQENMKPQTGAGVHESSEAIEQHVAQKTPEIHGNSEVQEGTEEREGRPGSQGGPESRESPATQESPGIQGSAGVQDTAEVQETARAQDSGPNQYGTGVQEGPGVQNGAGAGIQESAKTQRS